jgi:hypothetical protein
MTAHSFPTVYWPFILSARRAGASQADDDFAVALSHIRTLFGERVEDLPPLLLQRLLDLAPWTRDWLVWFSRAVRSVEAAGGYVGLQRRLIDPARFDEACSVLEVAERLVEAGLTVDFDPVVEVGSAHKMPDLGVADREAAVRFHAEVSVRYNAAALTEQSQALDATHFLLRAAAASRSSRRGRRAGRADSVGVA